MDRQDPTQQNDEQHLSTNWQSVLGATDETSDVPHAGDAGGQTQPLFHAQSSFAFDGTSSNLDLGAVSAFADTIQDATAGAGPSFLPMNEPLVGRSTSRRPANDDASTRIVDMRRIPTVEKDADNTDELPGASGPGISRQRSTTLTTLSRLFAVGSTASPGNSRSTSYVLQQKQQNESKRYSGASQSRNISSQTMPLPTHLYTRGLLEGRHSDITVIAFSCPYKLHRLVLDRAPFFASALSDPWLESGMKEIAVHPEDIDSAITQTAFELALKRLYGCNSVSEEDAHATGLFATGCWLEMQDLIDSSVESMLRYMTPRTLAPLIKFVTGKYYGRAGDKILASAKSMLCRDGTNMPIRFWDGVPGEVVREIVGGDGLFVESEWDRWVLAKRILDRRLKALAIETGLVEANNKRRPLKAPDTYGLMAVRFDAVYRRSDASAGQGLPDHLQKWLTPYTCPDLEPILVLLDEGIHYIHLDFEQLQYIRRAKDAFGLPMLPDKVISNALWQQMELRQRIMNAEETELELGISVQPSESDGHLTNDDPVSAVFQAQTQLPKDKGKSNVDAKEGAATNKAYEDKVEDELESGSWDGNGKPRKFWIPGSDCNIVMGGNADPVIATSNATTLQRHASRLSGTMQPEDLQWVADFAAATSTISPMPRPGSSEGDRLQDLMPVRYSHFPPFRFSAEFPNPRLLKNTRRVYSRTVFYAGSLWNVYIQKAASSRSKQLGVYLHRAKEREAEDAVSGASSLNVDERIGQLEREMIMRSEQQGSRRQRRRHHASLDRDASDPEITVGDYSPRDHDPMFTSSVRDSTSTFNSFLHRRDTSSKDSQEGVVQSCSTSGTYQPVPTPGSDSCDSDLDDETFRMAAENRRSRVATIPPYVDARPTIKTYFKIYSPSRGGRMLSVYESAPDKFNFSQSWGWKSSTLMLDEGFSADEDEESKDGDEQLQARKKRDHDGRLKFSVVIGLI